MPDAPTRAAKQLVEALGEFGVSEDEVLDLIDDDDARAFVRVAARTQRNVVLELKVTTEYRIELGDVDVQDVEVVKRSSLIYSHERFEPWSTGMQYEGTVEIEETT